MFSFLKYCCSLLLLLGFTIVVIISGELSSNLTTDSDFDRVSLKKLCRQWKRKHQVNPGVSWGTLSTLQQDKWMKYRCDQFFCEPNEMEGKGVYRCIPLNTHDIRS
jgi:hypothetical protein